MNAARPTDTIRDAFEAILALLQMLIARKFSGLYTPAVRLGVEVGEQLDITHPHSGKPLLALRDLVTRAAEEHNRRAPLSPAEEAEIIASAPGQIGPGLTPIGRADWTPERIREARERCEPLRIAIEEMTTEEGEDPAEELFQSAREADPGSSFFDAHLSMIDAHRDRVTALRGAWIAAREDLPAALAEIERLAGKTATLSTELAEARTFALERADQADSALRRLHHAHDSANRLYGAARGILDDWQGSPEEPADVANLRRAIDPAEEASALTEVQRRDGLEREIERLTAELAARAPADASLEAAERTWRGEWQRIAADIRSMSEAGKTPADILAILLTHLDMMKPLAADASLEARAKYAATVYDSCGNDATDSSDEQAWLAVVRAVDASRPASPSAADLRAITVDWPRTNARRGALMDREDAGTLTADEITELADLQRLADMLVDKMHRDASRPGLTEEQADAIALGCLQVREDLQRHAIKRAILRVDRGETGPAHPLEWTCPKCGQRAVGLGARQSPELGCERCGHVERPAADLGPGVGGAPIRVRPPAGRRASLEAALHDPETAEGAAAILADMPPDPLALDPEDGTLCADCRAPRNTIHGALCSVRAGAKPGRAPDPRATLHAGDPERPDPRVDYSDGMRPAVLGGECAECLHAPPLHERTCSKLARRPQ